MGLFPLLWPVFLLVLLCPSTQTQGYDRPCRHGHFFDTDIRECRPCSIDCPENQIIKRPCSNFSNLRCETFKLDGDTIYSYPSVDRLKNFKDEDDDRKTFEDMGSRPDKNRGMNLDGPTTMEREDQEYWKALAFALIALLSVLIVATVAVLFACCRLQRAVAVKQQEDGEMDDTDSGYVVIRAIRNMTDPRPGLPEQCMLGCDDELPSHSPLLEPVSDYGGSDTLQEYPLHVPPVRKLCFLPKVYNPQRRLLNYDTDDVFESEDSGGSVRFSSLTRLKTIPEKSDATAKSKENIVQGV